jgi:hypothetical protein
LQTNIWIPAGKSPAEGISPDSHNPEPLKADFGEVGRCYSGSVSTLFLSSPSPFSAWHRRFTANTFFELLACQHLGYIGRREINSGTTW